MTQRAAAVFVAVLGATAGTATGVGGGVGQSAGTGSAPIERDPVRPHPQRIEGLTIAQWHRRAVRNRRTINRLRRVLLHSPTIVEAINLAAATYGHGSTLWGLARCETGGTYSPVAKNSSSDASGLFQFMPSTFRSTPYGGFSIWSAHANALAAGWMISRGRRSEWVC